MPVLRTSRAVLLAVAVVILAGPAGAAAEVRAGGRAPELVKVVDRAGKKVRLARWKDRVVVLTFGASWCAPCKKELPAFEKLAAAYASKSARVVFVAINVDNERVKGEAFVKQAGLKHVVAAFDAGKASVVSFDPPKMPSTFVMRGGLVRHVHAGYAAGDEVKLAAVVDAELKKLK
jgi:cytochrome c biogenesis protein CcmG, thiol:disulfide interchange protein DsbE